MNFKSSYFLLILLALCFGCNDKTKSTSDVNLDTEIIGDNSMTSLDWEGTYEGIIPCADCEGIKTAITINRDNTYVARETYIGKSDSVFESKGTFKWDDNGQTIRLSDANRPPYFVGENTLTHLDMDEKKITGDMAERYILKKVTDKLTGKKWHLVSFKGDEIQLQEAKAERPFIEFAEDFTITGYTGCNNLRGGYTLDGAQKVYFSNLISTKKFCPEMETESEFISTLNTAFYYTFKDRTLVMYDEDNNRLAQFKEAN